MRFSIFNLLPFWQAVRRYSLTASVVFASAILGVSVVHLLRRLLQELSVPWIFLWIVPILLIGAAAKRENKWVPDSQLRRRLALGIVFGSIALALIIGRIRSGSAPPPPSAAPSHQSSESDSREMDPSGSNKEPTDSAPRSGPPQRHHRPAPRSK